MSDEENPAPEEPSASAAETAGPGDAAPFTGNSVEVTPGGETYPTIGEALAAINDASLQNQYLVTVRPGVYHERVVLKPYVYVQGAGQDQTTINFPPVSSENIPGRGAVVAAPNSSISDLTVTCRGGNWGDWSTALLVPASANNFHADNVALVCDDQGSNGINIETAAVNWNADDSAASVLQLDYSTVTARGEGNATTAVALMVGPNGRVAAGESKVVAQSAGQSFGVVTAGGGIASLSGCSVEGGNFALYNSDGASPITAFDCQLNGPVSNAVNVTE